MRTRFHLGLDELKDKLLRMGGMAESAVERAVEAYARRDPQLAKSVLSGEAAINTTEREIDELALDLLAMQQPMAIDLRFITAVMKINADLERVGDQAVNIAERAIDAAGLPHVDLPVDIPRMAATATGMVRQALEAFIRADAELAQQVLTQDNVVDRMNREIESAMMAQMKQVPASARQALDTLLIARNLERWVDAIMARTFSHQMVEKLAEHASIPVINGLTDRLHPCQILTDIFTVRERRGDVRGLKVAYVGDGNNVCNSWCFGAAKTGIHLAVGCPKGYEPDQEVWQKAKEDAAASGATLTLGHDPAEAVRDAHVIYTDVWASMGQEEEHAQRLRDFHGFQVDARLLERARPDVLVMHCLPAHRGEEIADDVIDGPHSIVFDEAENRLHVQKAILVLLMAPEAVTPKG